jgi:hypothetical protein
MDDGIIVTLLITDTDGSKESIAAEKISESTYKLLENPIFSCKINYGTIVKAVLDEEGNLIVTKVIRASDFKTRKFILPDNPSSNEFSKKIGNRIIDVGGTWEIAFGGVAFLHIPRNLEFDFKSLFSQLNYFPTEITE